jgi:ElaA protein
MSALTWIVNSYENLSKDQLFDIYQVRQEVFIVEQVCNYQDCDLKDKESFHLMGYDKGVLVAYLRICKPGVSYVEPAIGRVLTKFTERKKGYGIELMKRGIDFCNTTYSNENIRISAQQYLLPFYRSLCFSELGEVYLEDNIPHMEMLYISGKR